MSKIQQMRVDDYVHSLGLDSATIDDLLKEATDEEMLGIKGKVDSVLDTTV